MFIGKPGHFCCFDIVHDLGGSGGSQDDNTDFRMHEDPADGNGREVVCAEELLQFIYCLQVKLIGNTGEGFTFVKRCSFAVVGTVVLCAKYGVFGEFAGQETAGKRNAGNDAS